VIVLMESVDEHRITVHRRTDELAFRPAEPWRKLSVTWKPLVAAS
jgi:hypothetical protein